MFPAVEEVVEVPGDAPVEEEAHETPRAKLSVFRRQHINLGHPPTTLLTKILRDARATYLQMLLSNTVVLGTESYRLDGMAFQPRAQWFEERCVPEAELLWNSGRDTARLHRLGPARTVSAEPRESGVSTVIWKVHGGKILSAAPEHSRHARHARRLEADGLEL